MKYILLLLLCSCTYNKLDYINNIQLDTNERIINITNKPGQQFVLIEDTILDIVYYKNIKINCETGIIVIK